MLVRTVALLFGLVQALFPRRVVRFWMDLAAVVDPEIEFRPWVYTAARVEGVLALPWALRRCGGFGGEAGGES